MNSTQTLPRSLSRTRRTALGLVFASVVLGGTLTACGSDSGDTTCGELKDMSADERVDLLEDAANDASGDDEDSAQEFLDSSDDLKKSVAESLPSICEGEDDDTKLDDIDGFN